MTLVEHLLLPELRPFAISATMIVLVGGVELVTMLLGFSISELLGKAIDLDGDADTGLGHAMTWMNVRGVPLLVWITIALAFFSIAGFLIQDAARALFRHPLPLAAAVPLALLAALPFVRLSAGAVARVMPKDETYAIEISSLVGRVGTVAVGPLDQGLPGRVRVKDEHANLHTVAAVAAADSPPLPQGTAVLLVDRIGGRFLAVAASDDLTKRTTVA
jgi:hypothetical protein